jgi:hypothetical protein
MEHSGINEKYIHFGLEASRFEILGRRNVDGRMT